MTVMGPERTFSTAEIRSRLPGGRWAAVPARYFLLSLVLVVALGWRLNNLAFGLPSMWDPDEPGFMIHALKLLKEGTLNPGWFGHPGSTTIYLVALIDVLVVVGGLAIGRWDSIANFTAAAYANPALLFVPARLAMAILAVLCVWLTYLIGRRLFGTKAGLVAAALLALNPLHIAWSQVIRTDIHSSLFMLGCILFALRAGENGRLRDYLLSGMFVGFAAATKWPAATVVIATLSAAAYRSLHGGKPSHEFGKAGAAGLAAAAALFLASPYILIDWQTVLQDVTGENKGAHLGHTGGGLLDNLAWYLGTQVAGSMGWIGLALALAGSAFAAVRTPLARWILLPAAASFLLLISMQGMTWSRWVLPLLPLACILAAAGLVWVFRAIGARRASPARPAILGAIIVIALLPSLVGAVDGARERANDTRGRAAAWISANVPPGSTIALEHLELSLRDEPYDFLFPMGEAGCIDGRKALSGDLRYKDVQKMRKGSQIVDLGNVSENRIDSCRADYAILTYYDLYLAEASRYPRQLDTYGGVLAGGRTVALFKPAPGLSGGPVVRIVAMPQQ